LKSMTGFGRAEAEKNGRKITVEMKSVNHRFLDMNIRMPRTLMFLEDEVRNTVKTSLSRGRLEIFINYFSLSEEDKKVTADIGFIKAYLKAAEDIKQQCKLKDDVMLSHILRIPEAVKVEETQEDEDALRELLVQAVTDALAALTKMREKEGQSLKKDILERLDTLSALTEKIESREKEVIEEYRDKLKKRVTELLNGTEIDENRFQAEVVYYADRQNITEEVVRLKSHIAHFLSIVKNDEPKGRQFDFIVQEMNREFNTIGSKSASLEITGAVLEGKSEVEKIREQVQNIE
jgi:uncharacterized protein (TIGR00255 family)